MHVKEKSVQLRKAIPDSVLRYGRMNNNYHEIALILAAVEGFNVLDLAIFNSIEEISCWRQHCFFWFAVLSSIDAEGLLMLVIRQHAPGCLAGLYMN